ncbi:MAG TPA: hypothetical protein VGI80_00485 [Pyrinomonadaceae bacterium]
MSRNNYFVAAALTVAILAVTALVFAQQKKPEAMSCAMMDKMANSSRDDCPMMKKDAQASNMSEHDQMVMKNGEKAMGFSQTATTHHFLLMEDGGAIQVTTNDAKDTDNRDKIREHLKMIARQFKDGIFTTPFAVHGQVPAGVPEMDRLKDKIDYTFEEVENGARVRIVTSDAKALAAILDFLRFQITEHKTGDPMSAPEK